MSKYEDRIQDLKYDVGRARRESAITSKRAIKRKAWVSRDYGRIADQGNNAAKGEIDVARDLRDMVQDDNINGRKRTQKGIRLAETKLRRYKNTYKKVVRRKVGLGLGVAGALAGTAALVAKARSAKKD